MTPSRRELLGAAVSALVLPEIGCRGAARTTGAMSSLLPPRPPPTSPERSSPTLDILEANRRYDAQFARGLSNHLSMAIVALHDLGASDARLAEYFARYRRRLEPVPARGEPITPGTWREHLGTGARYADYLAFFEIEVAHAGADGALRAYLPALMPGVAGAGFHALLRLAYAVHARDAADVPVSLAYFADAYLPLGDPAPSSAPYGGTPLELLGRIAESPALANRSSPDAPIFERLRAVASIPEFAPVSAAALASRDVSLASLADAAAVLYASTPNLTSLHAVTAAHALRVLSPLLEDRSVAARYLLHAFAAVYVSMGAPPLLSVAERARMEASAVASWEAIASAAVASDDEHVIKLVYTCREEGAAYSRPLYRVLAAKKARLA